MNDQTTAPLRSCRDCNHAAWTTDDLQSFRREPNSRYGRRNLCKPCHSARSAIWRAVNPGHFHGANRDHLVWTVKPLSYQGVHTRLGQHFGRPQEYACVCGCGRIADQWSYTGDDPLVRKSKGLLYSLKPEYYQPMARVCHQVFDRAVRQRNERLLASAEHALAVANESLRRPDDIAEAVA